MLVASILAGLFLIAAGVFFYLGYIVGDLKELD